MYTHLNSNHPTLNYIGFSSFKLLLNFCSSMTKTSNLANFHLDLNYLSWQFLLSSFYLAYLFVMFNLKVFSSPSHLYPLYRPQTKS